MKKRIILWILLCILCLYPTALPAAALELTAVGQVVALELTDGSVTIAEFDETFGSAAQKAGLCVGDRIVSIDGKEIRSADDVRQALRVSKGTVRIRLQRQGKTREIKLAPHISADGPRLGVLLKQGVTGIGTVTWYDPHSGKFGMLGHGVNNGSGELVEMDVGTAYRSRIVAVTRGQIGRPGQLQGAVSAAESVGSLYKNSAQGVFGVTENGWEGRRVETAASAEITTGAASILCTVDGEAPQEYSVEILKLYPKNHGTGRNLLLRVTDARLLDHTGGIVQGMSGSPILQNGKLIGAVTHVLVNDPTTGYGIFIENMLDAAS